VQESSLFIDIVGGLVALFWVGWGLILLYGKRCRSCGGRLRESGTCGYEDWGRGYWTDYHCSKCGSSVTYSQYPRRSK